jgi:hypothetical protein
MTDPESRCGENIDETASIVADGACSRVSCEGEIGFVGYAGGAHSAGTDPGGGRIVCEGDRC